MKFSICNETFGTLMGGEWPWERVCKTVADFGYDGIEIAPFTFAEKAGDVTAQQRSFIKQVAADNSLEISALHWLLVSPPGLHINAVDQTVRLGTVDYMRQLIDLAGDLGAPVMIFGSPKQRRVENGDYNGAWQRAQESYRELLPALEARDVLFCQESLPAPECDFITSAHEAKRMVDEMAHPNFRLMLDVKSLCGESGDETGAHAAKVTRELGGEIEHYHVNDANRRGPGFGNTDFRLIAPALRDSGFDRYVSVEVFDYAPDPETIARESLRHLREVFAV